MVLINQIRITTIAMIAVLLFVMCCNEVADYEVANTREVSGSLSLKKVALPDSVEILIPTRFRNINDEFLLISEFQKQKDFLHVFRLPDLHYLYSWGTIGRGPDDLTVQPVYMMSGAANLYVYDSGINSIKKFEVTESDIVEKDVFSMEYDEMFFLLNNIHRISDSLFFAEYEPVGTSDFEYMAINPVTSQKKFTFGEYPESELDGRERYNRYVKTSVVNKSGTKFAAFYMRERLFKFVTFNDDYSDIANEEFYKIHDPYLPNEIAGHLGTTYAAAGEEIIVTRTLIDEAEFNSSAISPDEYSFIELWNWNGEQIKRKRVDEKIRFFDISEKYGKIYTMPYDGGGYLHVYDFQ